jgi:hypothetical protein
VQEAANRVPTEVSKTKEDYDIAVAGWFCQLRNCADPVHLHFNDFQRDNDINKAALLHLEFILRHLQVEAYLLKLCNDELDTLSMLHQQI